MQTCSWADGHYSGAPVLSFFEPGNGSDLASPLGPEFERHKEESVFYRDASFYTADEVERLLLDAGFSILAWAQTLTGPVEPDGEIEPARPGRGEGAFLVVHARNDKPRR